MSIDVITTADGPAPITPQVRARVNPRLLHKANRLFTGTVAGRIAELLQNARRAGATRVTITNQAGDVTVRDNGRGVRDFSQLLDLGGSGWDANYEASEDPAGVGLFCLAPRAVHIRSQGRHAHINAAGWRGSAVDVLTDPESIAGTALTFPDEPWSRSVVEPQAVFSGLEVTVDGQPCAHEPFVGPAAVQINQLGCRIEVRASNELHAWHRVLRRGGSYGDNVLVNFHGQTTSFEYHPITEPGLSFLVDLTGQPTPLRLLLPARTRLVENEAFAELKAALELEAFRHVHRRRAHRLPYSQYLRARELGIELPEATPTVRAGLLAGGEAPEPVAVQLPDGFPLARCYRFDPDFPAGTDVDETNAHLLAALGELPEPFIPVSIRKEYDGYAWASLPMIGQVTVTAGRALHSAPVWTGTLTCVDALVITVHTSDDRIFSAPVCLAKAPPPPDAEHWCDDEVLVTRAAEQRLSAAELWYHFGGCYDEGDTYDTQERDFECELGRFWADLLGPDERLRRSVMDVFAGLVPAWKSVRVSATGRLRVQFKDGTTKTIRPRRAGRRGSH